jgi:uncharacterized protein with PQ loop repeat
MGIELISTIAIAILSIGFWAQAYHIHKHQEVRDLSIVQYIGFTVSYSLLAYVAYVTDSKIFLIKQLMSGIPALVILCQIIYHRKDTWRD